MGRQPWIVYGLMLTVDAASPQHSAGQVGFTLGLFVLAYLVVFGAGTAYGLRLIGKGPSDDEGDLPVQGGPGEARQPMRPLSAAPDGADPAGDRLAPEAF